MTYSANQIKKVIIDERTYDVPAGAVNSFDELRQMALQSSASVGNATMQHELIEGVPGIRFVPNAGNKGC